MAQHAARHLRMMFAATPSHGLLSLLYVSQYITLVILRPVSLDSMTIVLIATLASGFQR
jgi:hypothetical protein